MKIQVFGVIPPGVHIPRRSAFEIPFMTGWPFPMSCLMQRTRTLEQRWETLCRACAQVVQSRMTRCSFSYVHACSQKCLWSTVGVDNQSDNTCISAPIFSPRWVKHAGRSTFKESRTLLALATDQLSTGAVPSSSTGSSTLPKCLLGSLPAVSRLSLGCLLVVSKLSQVKQATCADTLMKFNE